MIYGYLLCTNKFWFPVFSSAVKTADIRWEKRMTNWRHAFFSPGQANWIRHRWRFFLVFFIVNRFCYAIQLKSVLGSQPWHVDTDVRLLRASLFQVRGFHEGDFIVQSSRRVAFSFFVWFYFLPDSCPEPFHSPSCTKPYCTAQK